MVKWGGRVDGEGIPGVCEEGVCVPARTKGTDRGSTHVRVCGCDDALWCAELFVQVSLGSMTSEITRGKEKSCVPSLTSLPTGAAACNTHLEQPCCCSAAKEALL